MVLYYKTFFTFPTKQGAEGGHLRAAAGKLVILDTITSNARVQIFFAGLKGVKMPALIDLQTKKIALSNEFPTTELKAEYMPKEKT